MIPTENIKSYIDSLLEHVKAGQPCKVYPNEIKLMFSDKGASESDLSDAISELNKWAKEHNIAIDSSDFQKSYLLLTKDSLKQKCATKVDSTGQHCSEEGIYKVAEGIYFCEKCIANYKRAMGKIVNISIEQAFLELEESKKYYISRKPTVIMKELDILEIEVLKTIERCSVFSILEIRMVYQHCNSFDKTVELLKQAVETKTEPTVLLNRYNK